MLIDVINNIIIRLFKIILLLGCDNRIKLFFAVFSLQPGSGIIFRVC